MCIKDKTTKEEREERSRIKNLRIRKMMKGIAYKNEGELFLISLRNVGLSKLNKRDNYIVEMV